MATAKQLADVAWDQILAMGQSSVELMRDVRHQIEDAQQRWRQG